jgi:predicted lipid-binding transport protein (Tim44 family)
LPALEPESEYDVDIYTIIFLALAVFIFLRLRSVLGQRTGSERPPYDRAAPNVVQRTQDNNNVVPMPGAVIDQAPLAPSADVAPADRWKGVAEPGTPLAPASMPLPPRTPRSIPGISSPAPAAPTR